MKKGFTIVELVIVIAVIAILAAVLIPTFSSVINRANISSEEAFLKDVATGLQLVVVKYPEVTRISFALNDGYLQIMARSQNGDYSDKVQEELRQYIDFDGKKFEIYAESDINRALRYDGTAKKFSINFSKN